MKKLFVLTAGCGLLSGAALAEPLTLDATTLDTVNGGVLALDIAEIDQTFTHQSLSELFKIDIKGMPTNASQVGIGSEVIAADGEGSVDVDQSDFSVDQMADFTFDGVELPDLGF